MSTTALLQNASSTEFTLIEPATGFRLAVPTHQAIVFEVLFQLTIKDQDGNGILELLGNAAATGIATVDGQAIFEIAHVFPGQVIAIGNRSIALMAPLGVLIQGTRSQEQRAAAFARLGLTAPSTPSQTVSPVVPEESVASTQLETTIEPSLQVVRKHVASVPTPVSPLTAVPMISGGAAIKPLKRPMRPLMWAVSIGAASIGAIALVMDYKPGISQAMNVQSSSVVVAKAFDHVPASQTETAASETASPAPTVKTTVIKPVATEPKAQETPAVKAPSVPPTPVTPQKLKVLAGAGYLNPKLRPQTTEAKITLSPEKIQEYGRLIDSYLLEASYDPAAAKAKLHALKAKVPAGSSLAKRLANATR